VILTGVNGVQPDLVFISNENREVLTTQGVRGAPDLVVEILSPSTRSRDLGIKLRAYQAAGVPNYWIADPRARTLEERVLGEDGYGQPTVYRVGETSWPLHRGCPSMALTVNLSLAKSNECDQNRWGRVQAA
jgi:Uma2 family endonuclease